MNIKPLYLNKNEKFIESGAFVCLGFPDKKCGRIYNSARDANECCNAACSTTGCKFTRSRGYTVCVFCKKANDERRERERYKKAKKVKWTEYDRPVYDDLGGQGNDGFFNDAEELIEHYYEEEDEELSRPAYCYGTTSRPFVLDSHRILEDELESHFEDAQDALIDEDEFHDFFAKWLAKQSMESWEVDYSTAVLLPSPLGIKEES